MTSTPSAVSNVSIQEMIIEMGAKQIAGSHPLWAGIGAYRLSSEQIVENARTARRLGVGGIILFSYDSLADPARGPGYLSQVGRAAFQF